jgi:hypothetical protein
LVPGQVAWDNALNALEEGDYGSAALHATAMLGEQVLTVLTLGTSQIIGRAVTAVEAGVETSVAAKSAGIASDLEALGGGIPRSVPTAKGATQFIFPNGTVLRFDIQPGQYLRGQGPHINLEVPGNSNPNIHIPLKP